MLAQHRTNMAMVAFFGIPPKKWSSLNIHFFHQGAYIARKRFTKMGRKLQSNQNIIKMCSDQNNQTIIGASKKILQYLIDFCRYNNYIITSTYFSKPPQKQCTFKSSETEGFAAPWTPDRFAQLDHILCPKRWKNTRNDERRRDSETQASRQR